MLRTDSAADRSFDGNGTGSTIEEFAIAHQLPSRWVELRKDCSQLAGRADFWYRADLRDAARQLAVEASDILHSSHKRRSQSAPGETPRNFLLLPCRREFPLLLPLSSTTNALAGPLSCRPQRWQICSESVARLNF
jgi:hypothetical protein